MQQETHKNDAASHSLFMTRRVSSHSPKQKTVCLTLSTYKELQKLAKESGMTMSNVIAKLIGLRPTKHRYIKYYELEVGQDMLVPWHSTLKPGSPPNSSVIIRAIRTQASKYNMEFTWKREQKGLRVIRIR